MDPATQYRKGLRTASSRRFRRADRVEDLLQPVDRNSALGLPPVLLTPDLASLCSWKDVDQAHGFWGGVPPGCY